MDMPENYEQMPDSDLEELVKKKMRAKNTGLEEKVFQENLKTQEIAKKLLAKNLNLAEKIAPVQSPRIEQVLSPIYITERTVPQRTAEVVENYVPKIAIKLDKIVNIESISSEFNETETEEEKPLSKKKIVEDNSPSVSIKKLNNLLYKVQEKLNFTKDQIYEVIAEELSDKIAESLLFNKQEVKINKLSPILRSLL